MNPKRFSFAQAVVIACVAAVMTACANNPLRVAETPLQKAYAIEASYNIVLEQAVNVATSQPDLRQRIQQVEARTTPTIDQLGQLMVAYTVERAKVAAGESTEARLTIVAGNLENWITQAERALIDLSAVLE